MNPFIEQDDERDGPLRTIEVNQAEIVAFQKAMLYLKFACEETDSLLYAGSDSLNSLLYKIMKASDMAESSASFYNQSSLMNETFVEEKLKRLEQEQPYVKSSTHEQTQQWMKSYMYPFPYSGGK